MIFAVGLGGMFGGWWLGLYLGERWAIRQISDKETRKHLSNPNKEIILVFRHFD
jgi:membrane protein YqaA with SNARE-associated domain